MVHHLDECPICYESLSCAYYRQMREKLLKLLGVTPVTTDQLIFAATTRVPRL
jgi:hypothetical protein